MSTIPSDTIPKINGLHAQDLKIYYADEIIADLEYFEGVFTVETRNKIIDGDQLRTIADAVDYANKYLTDRLDKPKGFVDEILERVYDEQGD